MHYAVEKITKYSKGGKELDVFLEGDITSLVDLQNLFVKSSANNNSMLLGEISEIELKSASPLITRYNKERCVKVFCDVSEGYSPVDISNTIEYELLSELDHSGTKITFAGEREEINRDFGNVGMAAAFSVLLVYILLLLQFRSFMQPFVIMLTLPLAAIGAVFGLLLFNEPLSFTAMLGLASLIGIVVNDAILLITFINEAKRRGLSQDDACKDAASKRFVPIMMTTVTTVVGLIPLALSGTELFGPMSVVIIVGLAAATALTLIIIPVFYTALVKDKH